MNDHVIIRLLKITREHLITASVQINHASYLNIYYTKEALVLLLELLLVKYLNG